MREWAKATSRRMPRVCAMLPKRRSAIRRCGPGSEGPAFSLEPSDGNRAVAARSLGLHEKYLLRLLKSLAIHA